MVSLTLVIFCAASRFFLNLALNQSLISWYTKRNVRVTFLSFYRFLCYTVHGLSQNNQQRLLGDSSIYRGLSSESGGRSSFLNSREKESGSDGGLNSGSCFAVNSCSGSLNVNTSDGSCPVNYSSGSYSITRTAPAASVLWRAPVAPHVLWTAPTSGQLRTVCLCPAAAARVLHHPL